jgi:hypothetical protein
MPEITLPDGSKKHFDQPISVADVAASIGPGLAPPPIVKISPSNYLTALTTRTPTRSAHKPTG